MADSCGRKSIDPRIVRTRQLLQGALEELLLTRRFEDLSVQDITDAATLNRATFYAHYPDKFALLECLVAQRFHALLARRGVRFDGTCVSAIKAIALGVCDFLADAWDAGGEPLRRIEPHMESAIIAVVRAMLLEGMKRHPGPRPASPEMQAGTVSWAIYGGAKEWVQASNRSSSEEAAETVMHLILPIIEAGVGAPA